MRVGVSSWAWTYPFGQGDLELIDRQAGLGADHFELGGEAADDWNGELFRALGERLKQREMTASVCGIFSAQRDLSSEDPDVRTAGGQHLRACVDAAASIGGEVVVGAFCGTGGTRLLKKSQRSRRIALAIEALQAAGAYASKAGVRLAVEALNRYENNLLNRVEHTAEVVEGVAHPAVGFHIDLFHAHIEEASVIDAIESTAGRLFHCHAVDTNRLPPGEGHARWKDIGAALVKAEYSGALVIETFDPANPILAPLAGFWHPLPRPQDAMVRDGIALLREVSDG